MLVTQLFTRSFLLRARENSIFIEYEEYDQLPASTYHVEDLSY